MGTFDRKEAEPFGSGPARGPFEMIQHGMAGRQESEGPAARDRGVVPWPPTPGAKGDGYPHDCASINGVRDFCEK
eukprot:scaffold435_cov275-Chaetoceros_neogracile.AAC.99